MTPSRISQTCEDEDLVYSSVDNSNRNYGSYARTNSDQNLNRRISQEETNVLFGFLTEQNSPSPLQKRTQIQKGLDKNYLLPSNPKLLQSDPQTASATQENMFSHHYLNLEDTDPNQSAGGRLSNERISTVKSIDYQGSFARIQSLQQKSKQRVGQIDQNCEMSYDNRQVYEEDDLLDKSVQEGQHRPIEVSNQYAQNCSSFSEMNQTMQQTKYFAERLQNLRQKIKSIQQRSAKTSQQINGSTDQSPDVVADIHPNTQSAQTQFRPFNLPIPLKQSLDACNRNKSKSPRNLRSNSASIAADQNRFKHQNLKYKLANQVIKTSQSPQPLANSQHQFSDNLKRKDQRMRIKTLIHEQKQNKLQLVDLTNEVNYLIEHLQITERKSQSIAKNADKENQLLVEELEEIQQRLVEQKENCRRLKRQTEHELLKKGIENYSQNKKSYTDKQSHGFYSAALHRQVSSNSVVIQHNRDFSRKRKTIDGGSIRNPSIILSEPLPPSLNRKKSKQDQTQIAKLAELERKILAEKTECEKWRKQAENLEFNFTGEFSELKVELQQIGTEYHEDLNYTKIYFDQRMKDLVQACSRQVSKELFESIEMNQNKLEKQTENIHVIEMQQFGESEDDFGVISEPSIRNL